MAALSNWLLNGYIDVTFDSMVMIMNLVTMDRHWDLISPHIVKKNDSRNSYVLLSC